MKYLVSFGKIPVGPFSGTEKGVAVRRCCKNELVKVRREDPRETIRFHIMSPTPCWEAGLSLGRL